MLERTFLKQPANGKLYVEDVFSTYLYTGNGSTQTITNGIDLSGKGGLVWVKSRSAATNNFLFDTARGANVEINSNTTDANATLANSLTTFGSTGFTLGGATGVGTNAATYASWTFREAPKFFDVVTWSGDGVYGRVIPHNLGVDPGCIIIKHLSGPYVSSSNWVVWNRGDAANVSALNTTGASTDGSNKVPSGGVTSTSFQVGGDSSVNRGDGTYVAYLFAHDATSDGIIQCGSYTGNGSISGPSATLGWEPQYLMVKRADAAGSWQIIDNMRGMPVGSADATLQANTSSAETSVDYVSPTATGFQITSTSSEVNASGSTYIYIAIRRGPMKTPTSGTSVFSPNAVNVPQGTQITSGFPVDMTMATYRPGTQSTFVETRLNGVGTRADNTTGERFLNTTSVLGESTEPGWTYGWNNTGFLMKAGYANADDVFWSFRRAPGFFDEVCYTGTGVARTLNHNLGVAPELMIVKRRDNTGAWQVYSANLANTEYLVLNTTAAKATGTTRWNSTTPTSTVLTVGTDATVNASGGTYVAYLFASCPGVSKVGSFTGNGSSQTINCGFAAGARFVMIKRTDSTGDWYVWDTARGMVAANDPHLSLNSATAEVTTDDSVDTDNTGFIVNQVSATNVNVNGASYIYLAIA